MRFMNAIFDALEKAVGAVQSLSTNLWSILRDRFFHHLFFYLILAISGAIVCIKAVAEETDRLIAAMERAFISVSLMIMSVIYFLVYFNREAMDLGVQGDGLAKWSVTLMVWVGFLGASLATRRRSHLSVDATDRILSPKAARLVKRFTALIAAIFCWAFVDFARQTVDDSLFDGMRQEALPLLDWMVAPINGLGHILFADGGLTTTSQLLVGALIVLVYAEIRRQRTLAEASLPPTLPDEDPVKPPLSIRRVALDGIAGIGLVFLLLSMAADRWSPIDHTHGEQFIWEDILTTSELADVNADILSDELEAIGVSSVEELVSVDVDEGWFSSNDSGDSGLDDAAGSDDTGALPSTPSAGMAFLDNLPTAVDTPEEDDVARVVDDRNEHTDWADTGDVWVAEASTETIENDDIGSPSIDEPAPTSGSDEPGSAGTIPEVENATPSAPAEAATPEVAEEAATPEVAEEAATPEVAEEAATPEVAEEAATPENAATPSEVVESAIADEIVPDELAEPVESASVRTDITEDDVSQFFPIWLIQAVLPLSFLFMSLRFGMLAFFGKFEETLPDKESAGSAQKISDGKGAKDLILAGLVPGMILGICIALGMGPGPLIFMGGILLLFMGAPLFLIVGVATVGCVIMLKGGLEATWMTDAFGKEVLIPSPDQSRSPANQIVIDMFEAVKKEELLAIPFFVLAGNIMTQGSIAERLVGVARAIMGRFPGGLGLATIAACTIFAAISGSSPVTVIAVGGIMFPMLMRDRYPENYSVGVLTSAGSLGIIIPPSVPMIIYAIVVGMSITQIDPACSLSPNSLFLAGVLPGLFIAGMLVLYTLYQTRPTRKGLEIREPEITDGYWKNLGRELSRSIPSLLLPVVILGGIYGVLGPLRFTVTEAAAVAVIYALFVELVINRELKIKKLPKIFADSGVMMGSLFLIIVLAIAFNKFLTEQEVPQLAAIWLKSQIDSKLEFILLVNVFLLALGCVMDIISAILIVAPLLAPIALQFGIDPIHFGIMFMVNLELGYLTPPMGINLFVSSTVFKRGIIQVIRATTPFFFLMLFCLGVIALAPGLSTSLLGADTIEAGDQCIDSARAEAAAEAAENSDE